MTMLIEYLREKLDGVAGRILELLTGLGKYKLREVRERVPQVRRVPAHRPVRHFPHLGPPCDRW